MSSFEDFLGQTIRESDYVVYGSGSGRSINTTLGQVLEIVPWETEEQQERWGYVQSVKIQPVKSSRWKQHGTPDRYIDTRTGKGVDIHTREKDGSYRHVTAGPYKWKETGEWATWEDILKKEEEERTRQRFATTRKYSYFDQSQFFKWSGFEYKDYIRVEKQSPRPVTLSVTQNIVRVEWEPVD